MFWTPGHADVQGNEVADRLVKYFTDRSKAVLLL